MNKILVLVYVPLFEEEFDVVIPINQKVGIIKKILISSISEIISLEDKLGKNTKLYDKVTSKCYDNNMYVKNAGIKNGDKLILI